LDHQHSGGGNENGIGRSPDQFFPVGQKTVWEQAYYHTRLLVCQGEELCQTNSDSVKEVGLLKYIYV